MGKMSIEGYGPSAGNWDKLNGKNWAAWTSWAEGPVSML